MMAAYNIRGTALFSLSAFCGSGLDKIPGLRHRPDDNPKQKRQSHQSSLFETYSFEAVFYRLWRYPKQKRQSHQSSLFETYSFEAVFYRLWR